MFKPYENQGFWGLSPMFVDNSVNNCIWYAPKPNRMAY